jgi:hypothetical protein
MFLPLLGNALGSDIEDMKNLGKTINGVVAKVDLALKEIDKGIGQTHWYGTDAKNEYQNWMTQRKAILTSIQNFATTFSGTIDKQAAQQTQASA